jgi:hypothetical protein
VAIATTTKAKTVKAGDVMIVDVVGARKQVDRGRARPEGGGDLRRQ